MADEVRVVSLVLDASDYDRATQASERHTVALGEAAVETAQNLKLEEEALRKVAEAAAKASESQQKVGREVQQSAASWERLRSRLDPAIAGQTAYDRAVQNAERAVRRGHATQEEANRILDLARQRYLGIGSAAQAAARAEEQATQARTKARQSWQGLRESLDPALASQSRFARVQSETEAAVKAGIATQAQANIVLAQARERYLGAAPAAGAFARAQEEVDRSTRSWVSRIPLIGGFLATMNVTAVAAAAGVALLTVGLSASIAKAAEAERSQLRLESVLKATGNAAGLSGADLDRFADDLERGTLAQSEAVKQAASVLAASQSVSGETFKEVIRLGQDYAAVYGGDVVNATQAFAKALEEPERGISLLRRAGIGLSEAQQQLIKDFTATGERAKAQQIIIDELRKRIGGAGTAEAGGLSGAAHRFGEAWDDMLKRIGNSGPLQLATRLMGTMADELERVNRYASGDRAIDSGSFGPDLRNAARLADGPRFQQSVSRGVYNDLLGQLLTRQQVIGADEAQSLLGSALAGIGTGSGGSRSAADLEFMRGKVADLMRELNPLKEQLRQNQLQQDLLTSSWQAGATGLDAYIDGMSRLKAQAEQLRTPIEQLLKSQQDTVALSGLSPRERAREQARRSALNAFDGDPTNPNIGSSVGQAERNALTAFDRDQGYQFGRGIQQYDMQAAGLAKVAEAYKISTAAAEKAELRLRAEIETRDLGSAAADRLYQALLKEAEGRKAVEAAKLLADSARQVAEQELLTAALAKGTAQYERAKIAIEVARKVQAGFFEEGSAKAEEYAKSLETLAQAQARQGVIRDTQQLQQQNELLALELSLMGQRPEIIAREIALLKTKHQLANANVEAASKEGQELIERVKQNELLTRQLDQARKQQELLMEPFRNFIAGMQDALGQFFEDVFDGNVKSWKSAFGTVKNLAKQFAIEMLKLLTIQPAIQYVMNGFSTTGTAGQVSLPNIFNLFGGGGSGGGFGIPGFGGGGFNIPGLVGSPAGVGGGGMFGGLGNILSRPLSSLFGGSTFGGGALAAGGLEEIAALTGGGFGPSLVGGGGFLDSLSIGGGLGALGGAFSGITQLMQGGRANTIGGITSLVGAGVSLIPGVGQILGPLISMAGPILGGLFGKKKKKYPNSRFRLVTIGGDDDDSIFEPGGSPTVNTPFGMLGYHEDGSNERFTGGDQAGPYLDTLAEIDRSLAGLLTPEQIAMVAAGLRGVGGRRESFRDDPNGREFFAATEDRLQAIIRSLYGSTVASKGFEGIARSDENIEELAERAHDIISLKNAIADFGKTANAAEEAVKSIQKEFAELKTKAEDWGFSAEDIGKIETERKRLLNKLAIDFNEGVAQQILAIDDPYAAAMADLQRSQTDRRKEALYLVEQYEKGVLDTLVDINKLEELFGKERVALQEQYLEALGASWKGFFDELTLGPLSSKSNREKYQQALGEYQDVRQRASTAFAATGTLDPALAAEFQNEARQALQFSRLFNASGPETAALYDQILQLVKQFGNIPGFADGGTARGLAWVGERGPELRYFRQPTQILSAERSAALVQSMSGNVANTDLIAAIRNLMQGVGGMFQGSNDNLIDELQQLRGAFLEFLQERRATQATNAAAGGGAANQPMGRRRYAARA